MVWAGVTADRRTDLVGVPRILTGQRYIDEILRPHVVPFLCPVGNNGIFQDDNARPHRAGIVNGFLQANNVRMASDVAGPQLYRACVGCSG